MAYSADVKHMILDAVASLPVYQYALIDPRDIVFDEHLRVYCRRQCPHYKTCWSCPPVVGTTDKCAARCRAYEGALFFSMFRSEKAPGGIPQDLNKEPFLSFHEKTTCRAESLLAEQQLQTYTLTGNVCTACRRCTYPKSACRYPETMHPCLEGHGIRVSALTAQCGMDLALDDSRTPLLFSLIFFKRVSLMIR